MTEKAYRENPAISRSELFKIRESPEKFKYYKENPEPATPSLLLGQVFHKLALLPDEFCTEFAVAPNVDRRTKDGKAKWEEFVAESEGKTVVPLDMYERACAMVESLNSIPLAKALLNGEHEIPYFWDDDLTGEPCKCRADCVKKTKAGTKIIDLKSTNDASTDAFMRDAIKYGYDFQAGMYLEGYKQATKDEASFVFVVVEKEPPYSVNILEANKTFTTRGYDLFREYIGTYHECKITDNWWGYLGQSDMINELSLPAWLLKEIE